MVHDAATEAYSLRTAGRRSALRHHALFADVLRGSAREVLLRFPEIQQVRIALGEGSAEPGSVPRTPGRLQRFTASIQGISNPPDDYERLIDLCIAFHDRFAAAHPEWFTATAARSRPPPRPLLAQPARMIAVTGCRR